jgi:hypothetical protein
MVKMCTEKLMRGSFNNRSIGKTVINFFSQDSLVFLSEIITEACFANDFLSKTITEAFFTNDFLIKTVTKCQRKRSPRLSFDNGFLKFS